MTALKWERPLPDWRKYHVAADGSVEIDYFANAVGQHWRVHDVRGVSRTTPKPIEFVLSFHRTLAEAKAHAQAATWHLAPGVSS